MSSQVEYDVGHNNNKMIVVLPPTQSLLFAGLRVQGGGRPVEIAPPGSLDDETRPGHLLDPWLHPNSVTVRNSATVGYNKEETSNTNIDIRHKSKKNKSSETLRRNHCDASQLLAVQIARDVQMKAAMAASQRNSGAAFFKSPEALKGQANQMATIQNLKQTNKKFGIKLPRKRPATAISSHRSPRKVCTIKSCNMI